jgi:glycosyltransferase involved in cell wall biosynthesis
MTTVPISVVIPTYNRAPLIRRAVESVLGQTVKAAEVLVIDDGSKDDTGEQVKVFGDAIRYIYQTNAGASESRNRGVREAGNPWVAFLDSDDVWLETHLERMSRAIAETGGRAEFYFDDMGLTPQEGEGTLWQLLGFTIREPFEFREDATEWVTGTRQPTMLQCSVFRKESYLAEGGLLKSLRLTHDTHLFLKLGIGRAACAVAGCGTMQTADDINENRLTTIFSGATRAHWEECVTLWQDILSTTPGILSPYRKIIRGYLADARWRLARAAVRDGNYVEAAEEIMRVFLTQPSMFLTVAARNLHGEKSAVTAESRKD